MKFRKKPVVIEAIQATADNGNEVARFLGMLETPGNKIEENMKRGFGAPELFIIKTLEGDMMVRHGDWIIKGVNGEFYPCKPDIFAKTYDVVDETVGQVTLESRYRAALVTLVGVHTLKELQDMEVIVRLSGMPAEEKTNILAAINLLIETAPKS